MIILMTIAQCVIQLQYSIRINDNFTLLRFYNPLIEVLFSLIPLKQDYFFSG